MLGFSTLEIRVHREWRLIVAALLLGAACYLPIGVGASYYHFIFIGVFIFAAQALGHVKLATYGLLLLLGLLNSQAAVEPRLDDNLLDKGGYYRLNGEIRRVEARDNGSLRLTIKNYSPLFVARVTTKKASELTLEQGDSVKLAAILSKPSGPVVPGGFNFARDAFFKGIDAQGFVVSPIEVTESDFKNDGLAVFRQRTARLLFEQVGGQSGAIAAALLVGDKSYLSEQTKEDLRKAGLSHLLAISGLHIGLVAVICFYIFEYIIASFPQLAYRFMPRKLAVLPTFLVVVAYMFVSGASVATIRAVIMISVAMLALLTDRRVISLRSVAIAAILILLIWPASIISISFQLSFAATASLVAFYEWFSLSGYLKKWQGKQRMLPKITIAVLTIMITSLISQVGILPFALYHFQEISLIALVSNVLVVPLVSFAVMPLLLCFLIGWALFGIPVFTGVLAYFIKLVIEISSWCASISWASIQTHQLSELGFLCLIAVFFSFLFLRERWILFGLLASVPVIFAMGFHPPADVLIDRNAKFIAAFKEEKVAISTGYRDSFRNRMWLKYWAADEQDVTQLKRYCDTDACLYEMGAGQKLAVIKTIDAVRQACSAATVIIVPKKYKRYCKTSALILTDAELQARGPLGLWYSGHAKNPKLKWSVSEAEQKPWVE